MYTCSRVLIHTYMHARTHAHTDARTHARTHAHTHTHTHTHTYIQELDPVTLHNQALMNMEESPTAGFEKMQFLLQQVPCPPGKHT